MTMSSFAVVFLFTALCVSVGNGDFVSLQCMAENVGEYGQQSLLECVVKPTADAVDVIILMVLWRKVGVERPLLVFSQRETELQPGYMFAEPSWNVRNMNVSLLITNTAVEHGGDYTCTVITDSGIASSQTSLKVTVLSVPSVSVSPSGEIMEGSSVTLTCSSDANPAATYTWYKENEDSRKASGQIFTITDIRPEHSGNYYCEAKNIRGRHNSTFHPIIVSRSMKSVAAGSITAILLVIIFLLAFLFIRRKRSLKQTSRPRQRPDDEAQVNMGVVYDTPSAPRQRPPSEQQGELCYDSVRFFKNQEDPLYSNIVLNQPNRHKEEEEDEDDVEYTVVNFNSASAATASRQEDAKEDSSALYSSVIKKPRV